VRGVAPVAAGAGAPADEVPFFYAVLCCDVLCSALLCSALLCSALL
jgi:hypothetical protein